MEDYSPYVPDVHFEKIPIKNLVSNQDYQRGLSTGHILRAAEHFDPYQINPVKVSRRGGVNYVFNGQHTIEIVALVSGSRDTPVWCMIYEDLEYETEADIFANQMKYVKPLAPYEIFMANIEAGNDKQLIIRDLVESYGLSLTKSSAPGGICAISTLENIHDRYGYQTLERVLRLCVSAWEGDPQSLSAAMLNSVARLVNCYGDQLKESTFKEKVKKTKEKKPTDKLADKTLMTKILQGIFGDAQKKTLVRYAKKAEEINKLEDKYQKMTDKELAGQTEVLKKKIEKALHQLGEELISIEL